jgi:hypothetical protein
MRGLLSYLGAEPAVPASQRRQTHGFDRAATGIGILGYNSGKIRNIFSWKITPCSLIKSDYQREEKFLYCINRSSRFIWKGGTFIPNQTASQYRQLYTWHIFLAFKSVCLLEHAVATDTQTSLTASNMLHPRVEWTKETQRTNTGFVHILSFTARLL